MSVYSVLFFSDDADQLVPELTKRFESHPEIEIKFQNPVQFSNDDLAQAEFIMLDHSYYLKNQQKMEMVFQHSDKLSIFATPTGPEQMNEILKNTKVSHFFWMAGASTFDDMARYLLASIENKFWTSETFITSPLKHHSLSTFATSEKLDQKVESAIQPCDFSGTFDDFRTIVIQIINEMLTNALYNAPIDNEGNFLYQGKNRREVVSAESGKMPVLEIVEDENRIVLSVKDFYGTLKKDTIDHYLTHGEIADKEGGAGLGLFLILKYAHQLVINLEPGKMTEMMIVLQKFKRFYHYQSSEKSFHLFQRKTT